MQFERTEAYEKKLFSLALFDEKRVIIDAEIVICTSTMSGEKLKAYCRNTQTYLQFPRHLRVLGAEYVGDVVEVVNKSGCKKFYRTMSGSIRKSVTDNEVLG